MGGPYGLPSTRFHPKLKGDYVIPLFGGKFFPTIRWLTNVEISENTQVILILVAGIDGKRRRYWDSTVLPGIDKLVRFKLDEGPTSRIFARSTSNGD